jgi:hypothetical protein
MHDIGLQTEVTHANLGRNTDMTPIKTTKTTTISTKLIAPCGMNCCLCIAFTRETEPCPDCRGDDSAKSKTHVLCLIKNCEKISNSKVKYCYSCDSFPCSRLKDLDKRYRTKYGMSMIDYFEYPASSAAGMSMKPI